MWHKALWMRNYKQGKLAFWLLVATSLFTLPITYLFHANQISNEMTRWKTTYFHEFSFGIALWPLGGLLILLACQVINGHHENLLLSFPFRRCDIFLSKWFFGALVILGMAIVNLALMFLVHITTIHGQYSTFEPFLTFFLFMPIALLAIYSLSLLIGTITGKMIVQGVFSFIACIFPVGILGLLQSPFSWHGQTGLLASRFNDFYNFATEISLHSIRNPRFFISQSAFFDEAVSVHYKLVPSLTTYFALLLYIGVGLLIGLYLYKNFPSEHFGRVILHKHLESVWLWGTILCMGILGTNLLASIFWDNPLPGQIIGFFIFSAITYLVLSRFTHKKVSLKSRGINQQVI